MLALLLALFVVNPPLDVIDRIMAVVNQRPITLSEVVAARQFGLVTVPDGTADPTRYVLDRLIDRSLMLAEVDRFQPPEPTPVEITLRVDRMVAQAGSPEAFDAALAVTGTTREQLRRYVRDSLRMDIYVAQRFGAMTAPGQRDQAIANWAAELRRRAQITVLYRPEAPTRGPSR
jgi:hypothetical protein